MMKLKKNDETMAIKAKLDLLTHKMKLITDILSFNYMGSDDNNADDFSYAFMVDFTGGKGVIPHKVDYYQNSRPQDFCYFIDKQRINVSNDHGSQYQVELISDLLFLKTEDYYCEYHVATRLVFGKFYTPSSLNVYFSDSFSVSSKFILESLKLSIPKHLTSKMTSYLNALNIVPIPSFVESKRMSGQIFPDFPTLYEYLSTISNILFFKYPLEMQYLFFQKCALRTKSELGLIGYLIAQSNSIVSFKFPYTLACIAARTCDAKEFAKIQKLIYNGLNWIAKEQIFNAKIIASYKLLLKNARKKQFISQHQKYELDSIAEDNKTFSDPRFRQLQHDVDCLNVAVKTNQQNINTLGMALNDLKDVMIKSKKRALVFGVARTFLSIVGLAGITTLLESEADFSDLSELGALIFNRDPGEVQDILDRGYDYLQRDDVQKSLIRGMSPVVLKKMGFDPQEFINNWSKSHVVLTTGELPNIASQKYLLFSGDKVSKFFSSKIKERQVITGGSDQSKNWLSQNSSRLLFYGATGLIILLVCYLLFQNNATDSTTGRPGYH